MRDAEFANGERFTVSEVERSDEAIPATAQDRHCAIMSFQHARSSVAFIVRVSIDTTLASRNPQPSRAAGASPSQSR